MRINKEQTNCVVLNTPKSTLFIFLETQRLKLFLLSYDISKSRTLQCGPSFTFEIERAVGQLCRGIGHDSNRMGRYGLSWRLALWHELLWTFHLVSKCRQE
jgi:hypothetical protein